MTALNLINVFLLVAGLFLHHGMVIQSKVNSGVYLGTWLQRNGLNVAISVVAGFALLLIGPTMLAFLGVPTPEGADVLKFHAFASGYLGSSLLRRLRKLVG